MPPRKNTPVAPVIAPKIFSNTDEIDRAITKLQRRIGESPRASIMSDLLGKIRDAIFGNPAALFFFVLAVIAEYNNYQRGHELTQVCELLSYPDVAVANPKTALGKVATICSDRLSDNGPDD
jgi:hypothetical protein